MDFFRENSHTINNEPNGVLSLSVLIIDDAAFMRKLCVKVLEQVGFYSFYEAKSVKDALKILHLHGDMIHVILLDYNMPGIDGFSLLDVLQKSNMRKKWFISMVTTNSDKKNIIQAIKRGANEYITKPISVLTMTQKLGHLVSKEREELVNIDEEELPFENDVNI
ncbi:response regulator [Fibrobacterales bacterium]|nr:response regulator [Fibrobacterales bacterium]